VEASGSSISQRPGGADVKRSLILAGGGMKVAFQAGVLQVLLDEADLGFDHFDHADGCSGGVFNLAMWCQGCTGKEIADNWRDFPVRKGIEPNWKRYWKLLLADSIMTMDRFRKNILREHWGLDWDRMHELAREKKRVATFNAYNFSRQELVVRGGEEVDEDFLIAGVSLPMWFPPTRIADETYIDAVYITDANLEEAIRRGADELWVIWTVSRRNEWVNGFVGNYFGIIETAANGHFKRICDRIKRNNEAMRTDGAGEFGRHIELKCISGEVPLHYLVDLNPDRFTQAVELGVSKARQWCLAQRPPARITPINYVPGATTSLHFDERMEGFLSPGAAGYDQGDRDGKEAGRSVTLRLRIEVDDVDAFISGPDHQAEVTGDIECEALGGSLAIRNGRFNLMPFEGDFDERWMFYWLPFEAGDDATKLVLSGYKRMVDDKDKDDLWSDATTLFTHVIEGWSDPPAPVTLIDTFRRGEAEGTVRETGIVRIEIPSFLKQLTTFRAQGHSKGAEMSALVRFNTFFVGGLWDVYARKVLSASPF
jgi:predicted acylesterase/phospholipase RssA